MTNFLCTHQWRARIYWGGWRGGLETLPTQKRKKDIFKINLLIPIKVCLIMTVSEVNLWKSPKIKKSGDVVRWDLEGPTSLGYLAHSSHLFFVSIRIVFSASSSTLSQSCMTPTSLAKLFIKPEFCQCTLRRSCQLQLF